jgi:hypothetical protein
VEFPIQPGENDDVLWHGKQCNDPEQNEIVNHQIVVIIPLGIDGPAVWTFLQMGANRLTAPFAFHHSDFPLV